MLWENNLYLQWSNATPTDNFSKNFIKKNRAEVVVVVVLVVVGLV